MTYSWKKGMSIDQQWESWQEHNPLDKIEAPDTETLKEAVVKDLSYVSAMDVKEYTLYQKWCKYSIIWVLNSHQSMFWKMNQLEMV